MKFKPLKPLHIIIANKDICFRNKLIYAYIYYVVIDNEWNENPYSILLKEILLSENTNKALYIKFLKIENLDESSKLILTNYNKELDDEKSCIKNNDLNKKIILKSEDFLPFASKSTFGGKKSGNISINIQNLELYLVKNATNTVKFQDECFLNHLYKVFSKQYCPFHTYLADNKKIAINLIKNSHDLRKNIMRRINSHYNYTNPVFLDRIRKKINRYYNKVFNDKKTYGLISAIIISSVSLNRDCQFGNIMIQQNYKNNKEKLLFFIIDPTYWSMDNKYNINSDAFYIQMYQAFYDFGSSVHNNMFQLRQQIVRFLSICLDIRHYNFLGNILTGIINLDPQFKNHDESGPINLIKEMTIKQFIEKIPYIVSQLTDQEIIEELKVFLGIDLKELDDLHRMFYNKNGEIYKLANTKEEDLTKGVQNDFIENLKYNLAHLQKKIKQLQSMRYSINN